MEAWHFFAGSFALLVMIFICISFNCKHRATDEEFRQAGVAVDFKKSTVKINRRIYSIDDIKSWRSESKSRGGSTAYIYLNDFKRPMHRISFVTITGAEVFLQRLNLAIERCYEYRAQNNAAAAD
ncbi:hypothetical protein [Solidesulfovibrio carbinolicus]|uniref:hypothetical protein n=1 Tax=Solidesulfovibrio carbinolicus TaxID=296842 RepID=UPI0010111282|nr:hypothetical protein [Solidesulfovibrio carbinolicus]